MRESRGEQVEFKFCGAAGSVTGSKHLVTCNDFQFLVDCGLVQERSRANLNWEPFLENPGKLDAVLLTHAHLDHCGLLPKLVADGFRGNIYGTPATLDLTQLILLDSAHIQEEDVAYKKKRHEREKRVAPYPERPLYTTADVEATARLFRPIRYNRPQKIANGVEVVFQEAGHILGSSFIEVVLTSPQVDSDEPRRLLFSGDLGRANRPILRDPETCQETEIISNLFIESTYGDRFSEPIDTVDDQLVDVVNRTVERGGKVIMPVFAVERSQEILCRLAKLRMDGRIPDSVPIFLDSPMAVEATTIFSRHRDCIDDETLELIEKAYVVFTEHAQVLDHVLQVGDALYTQTEGIAAIDLAVNAAGFENGGIHHTTTQDFNPTGVFAETATLTTAQHARDIHFGTRLGEGEIAGTQADLGIGTKQFLGKVQQHLLQVGKGHILVNIQTFNLVEEAVGAGRDSLVAVNASRADDADGRLVAFHRSHLYRTGVAAQHDVAGHVLLILLNEEGVLHVAGRMVGGKVQCAEHVPVIFHFRTVGNREAQA